MGGTTTDGAGLTYNANTDTQHYTTITSASVTTPAGAFVNPPRQSPLGAGTMWDRNGNVISQDASGHFYDTMSSTTPVLTLAGSGTPASPLTFTYTAPSGATPNYKVVYTAYSVQTNFQCPGIAEYGPITNNLVSEIDLPNGTKYTFAYEATAGITGKVTGRVSSVTLPTGGTITYAHNIYSNPTRNAVWCPDGSAQGFTRTTPDGSWTYYRTPGSGSAYTTKVTDPANNDTVISFIGPYETQRKPYQGPSTGTALRTINTCYNGSASPCTATSITLPITQRSTVTFIDNNQASKHAEFYNSLGLPTETDDYDFASGAPGSLLRKTVILYASLGNGIAVMPSTVTTCKPGGTDSACNGSGTVVAKVTNTYDEGTPVASSGTPQHISIGGSRGNLTTSSRLAQGANSLTSHFTYFDTGTLNSATDVNGAITTFSYPNATSTCGNAFPTSASITQPISMLRSFAWNCTGGVMTSLTDENGKITSTTYSDASFWRPAKVNVPDGGETDLFYTDTGNINVELKQKIDTTPRWTDSFTYFDALGRTSRQMSANGETSPWDQADTCYDSLGRVSFTSYPYQGNGLSTPKVCSGAGDAVTYDALSRPTQITHSDNSTVLVAYTGRSTQVQDEGNGTRRVSRVSQVDGLGRVVSLCEVSSITLPVGTSNVPAACGQDIAATGFLTTYGYDVLGDLLSVTQSGLNARTFTYDSLSRLLTSATPEAGTTTYVYDSDATCTPNSSGDLVKRIDARGVRTCFQYDALHRLKQKTYSDGTPTATYNYDQTSAMGISLVNTKGRQSSQFTAAPNNTGEAFSYDAVGRILSNPQCRIGTCTSADWTTNYTYDLAGDTVTATNGLGKTISYVYNLALRPTSVTSSFVDANHPATVLSAAHYNAAGALTSDTLGNSLTETRTYDPRLRLSTASTGSLYTMIIPTSGGYAPNSNVLVANDSANGNWTYGYDDFNRLTSASATGQPYTFDYDRYGNRWHQNGPHSSSLGFDANNRIVPGSGVTYDAAGNATNDGITSYTYDAEGRISSSSNTSSGLWCHTYNAAGQRIRKTQVTSGTCPSPTQSSWWNFVYDLAGHEIAMVSNIGLWNRGEVYSGARRVATYNNSTTYFISTDHLGTDRVRSTVSGTVYQACNNLPFGDWYYCPGSDASPVHFTGKVHTYESNINDFGARFYADALGRWMKPDPADLAASSPLNPQSWNRYSYVMNNPLNSVDPLGLSDCHPGEACWGTGGDNPGAGIYNFWDGRSYIGVGGGGAGGGTVFFSTYLPGFTIQEEVTTTETMIDGYFGAGEFLTTAVESPSVGGGVDWVWLRTFARTYVRGVYLGSRQPGESLKACIARNADQTTFGVSSKVTNGAFAAVAAVGAALGIFSQIPTQTPWGGSAATITNVVASATGRGAGPVALSAAGTIGGYIVRSLGGSPLAMRVGVAAATGASEGAMVGTTALTGASIGLVVGSYINCSGGLSGLSY